MSVQVKLSEIVEGMELQGDESPVYLDTRTGEVVQVTDQSLEAAEREDDLDDYSDWEREEIELARKILDAEETDFLRLPSRFDIHEYKIVRDFCSSVGDQEISDALLIMIKGSGAFRRFKEAIDRFGIVDQWYKYRDAANKVKAVEWCEENDIAYIDD